MIAAGTVLQDRYLIERQIGAGGMGTVYIATDRRFDSTVAVKETVFTDPNLRKAFEREARILNSMRHPVLPRVSDHFEEGDGLFIVMEYIAGEDLSEILAKNGAFPSADVLLWADQLLDALDYLHTQAVPIIHRDIKPQNLKLTPRGEIILLDFGLAKNAAGDATNASTTKSVFGYSRNYAPLEQIQGTGTDTKSDFYSLAATLYHLFTGSSPVDALTRATTVLNNQPDPLKPADRLNPQVPAPVAEVLHQAMALNAGVRPESAAVMRQNLRTAAGDLVQFGTSALNAGNLVAGAVPTQNTEFINNQTNVSASEISASDAPAVEQGGATNLTAAATNDFAALFAAPQNESATFVEKPEAEENAANPARVEVQIAPAAPVAAARKRVFPSRRAADDSERNSFSRAAAIAAALVLLGGGGLAAWYATRGSANPTQSTGYTQNANFSVGGQTVTINEKNKTSAPTNANQTIDLSNPESSKTVTTGESSATNVVVAEPSPNRDVTDIEDQKSTEGVRVAPTPIEIPVTEKQQSGKPSEDADEDAPSVDDSDTKIRDLRNMPPEEQEKMRDKIRQKAQEEQRRRSDSDNSRRRRDNGQPSQQSNDAPGENDQY